MYLKNFILSLKAVIALLLGFMAVDANCQVNVDTISFSITNPITDPNHNKKKAPFHYVQPTVCYYSDEAKLSFDSDVAVDIVYSVFDQDNQECLEGVANVQQDNTFFVSVSTLPQGDYTITIQIGRARFEGGLYIEE